MCLLYITAIRFKSTDLEYYAQQCNVIAIVFYVLLGFYIAIQLHTVMVFYDLYANNLFEGMLPLLVQRSFLMENASEHITIFNNVALVLIITGGDVRGVENLI